MTTPPSRAPTKHPDTSPANVARVLRCEGERYGRIADSHKADGNELSAAAYAKKADELIALTDALDAQATVTWEERKGRAAVKCLYVAALHGGNFADGLDGEYFGELAKEMADAALRAAFPELAPSDD